MCICVCICANNMQILGFGGVGGVRSGGGYHWGGRGGCGGPGTGLIYIYIDRVNMSEHLGISWQLLKPFQFFGAYTVIGQKSKGW